MAENGLIQDGEERDDPESGIKTSWRAVALTPFRDDCLVVMNVVTMLGDIVERGVTYEVVAMESSGVLRRFEAALDLPTRLVAAIGKASPDFVPNGDAVIPQTFLPRDLYYVEFSDKAAIGDVLKSVAAQQPYCGFSADISAKNVVHDPNGGGTKGDPDGKATFDPTPGRAWKLLNSQYSLRRGSTIEIHDVRPMQLDEDFSFYFGGSGGHVASWGSCVIRRLYLQNEWHSVLIDEPASVNAPPKTLVPEPLKN